MLDFAAANADVALAFVSLDPHRGEEAVREARRLIARGGVHGLKLHPPLQQFVPNDRLAYPLYEVFAEARLPVLFHTGHSGIGSGMRGGGGVRLKFGAPMPIDDVAVDFPDMPIVLAHPSFPWQDEAISICLHKPQVYIDLSGWSPKYLPPSLVQYANTLLGRRCCSGPTIRSSRRPLDGGVRQAPDTRRGSAVDPEGERGPATRSHSICWLRSAEQNYLSDMAASPAPPRLFLLSPKSSSAMALPRSWSRFPLVAR